MITKEQADEITRLAGLLSRAKIRFYAVKWGKAGPGINNETEAGTAMKLVEATEAYCEYLESLQEKEHG